MRTLTTAMAGIPADPRDRATEAVFFTAALFATGWPTATFGLPCDVWPFLAIAGIAALLHHGRLERAGVFLALVQQIRDRAARPWPRPAAAVLVVLVAAPAAAALVLERGPLLLGDRLVHAWLLATLHHFALGLGSAAAPDRSASTGGASLVPLTLLPLVLLQATGLPPRSCGLEALAIAIGFALYCSADRPAARQAAGASVSVLRPLLLALALPLVPLTTAVWEIGVARPGMVLFDASHDSVASVDTALVPGDRKEEPLPGHAQFVTFARALGFPVRIGRERLTDHSLTGVLALVLAMNRRPLAPGERTAVGRFVERGGGLLVIGDHTDVDGTSSAVNPLLESFGARFRFDTVWRRLDAVRQDVEILPHALTVGLERAHFSVGCSIAIHGGDLAPFVLGGPSTFSDAGDRTTEAFLGNSTRDAGERVGDLVLAAAGTHGSGRIIVLGDSAWLQNTAIGVNRRFAERVLWWLSHSERSAGVRPPARLFLIVLVSLILLALVGRAVDRTAGAVLLCSVSLTFITAAVTNTHLGRSAARWRPVRETSAGRVVVDLAHGNRCSFFFSRGLSAGDDAMDIWLHETEAHGHDVVFWDSPGRPLSRAALDGASVLVVVHPRTPYAPVETGEIVRFIENGGSLLLLVGPGPDGGRFELLPALGLTAAEPPVGLTAPRLYAGRFAVRSAYGEGEYPEATVASDAGVTRSKTLVPIDPVEVGVDSRDRSVSGFPFARALGRTIGVVARRTSGQIVLLGDRHYFTDFAFLDDNRSVDPRRTEFLADLLRFLDKRGHQ